MIAGTFTMTCVPGWRGVGGGQVLDLPVVCAARRKPRAAAEPRSKVPGARIARKEVSEIIIRAAPIESNAGPAR